MTVFFKTTCLASCYIRLNRVVLSYSIFIIVHLSFIFFAVIFDWYVCLFVTCVIGGLLPIFSQLSHNALQGFFYPSVCPSQCHFVGHITLKVMESFLEILCV